MYYLKSQFFTMHRILKIVFHPELLLKSKFSRYPRCVENVTRVRISEGECSDDLKISFKYGTFVIPKDEELEKSLCKIKKVIELQQQKKELIRAVYNKYSGEVVGASLSVADELEDDVEVSLIHDDQPLERNMVNIEAWTKASFLRIGQSMYEIDKPGPTVVKLSLPNTILAGCAIRPHFILERTNAYESSFVWYHSASAEEVEVLKSAESEDILKMYDRWWVKVHKGLVYWTSKNDIGRRLCVVCTPVLEGQSGTQFAAESKDVVRSVPESFPFEERHLYTKELTSADSIRCLSYNILANVYVETKKFPYCSKVAKDIYYRKQLLLRELLGYNSDIMCLQEVQERIFGFDLLPVLQEAGFDGYYMKKGGRRQEGLACFFRKSKFNVVNNEGVLLNEIIKRKEIFHDFLNKVGGNYKDMSKLLSQDSALQIVLLEHADNPKRRILVANTHLYSNKAMPEVRLLQCAVCVCYIEHVLKMEDAADSKALLFCGDFNSLPDSSVLEFVLQGSFGCCSSWNKNGSGPLTDTTLRHSLSLDSACGFPEYTNYTEEFSGCLDYIFYNKDSLSVSEIVPLPSHESVTQNVGLPSELFPSDHIPIICTLKWK